MSAKDPKSELKLEVVEEIPPDKAEKKSGTPAEKGIVEKGVIAPVPVRGQGEAQNKPMAYWEGDKLIIRASSFGSCFGALVRASHGITGELPPDFMLEKFQQGHDNEPIILGQLNRMDGYQLFDDWELEDEFGGPLHDGQVRLEIPVGDRIIIRQHFDQFTKIIGDESGVDVGFAPVEAKALAPSTYKTYQRVGLGFLPNYPWQVAIAGWATGIHYVNKGYSGTDDTPPFCPVVLAVGEKDDDGVVQEGKVHVHIVDEPPYSLAQIKMRAMEVLAKVEAGGMPECDWAQWPCPFYQDAAHKRGVWEKAKPISAEEFGIDGGTLVTIASDYQAGRDMEKRGKEIKNAGKPLLDELFDGRYDKPVEHDGVTVKPINTGMKKGRIDWEAAAKDAGVTDEKAEEFRGPESRSGMWYKVTVEEKDDE